MSRPEVIGDVVRRLGWLADFEVTTGDGTGNNRIFVLKSAGQRYLLKRYFQHPDDPRDRFGAELAFYQFAAQAGIEWVPKPLAWDASERLAMFEFIEGGRPPEATPELVRQAIEFFRAINAARSLPAAIALPVASEACFSLRDHLETVERRVRRLAKIEPEGEVDREAVAFVAGSLVPGWQQVARHVTHQISPERLERQLAPGGRCISPSDFGFHNSILAPDGRLRFFDFEYAGWDDPAKTVCDFFCQPAIPAPRALLDKFVMHIGQTPGYAPLFPPETLLPVYQIKWCCIMLNEFLPTDQRRRAFSNPGMDTQTRKTVQLAKARSAMTEINDAR